MGKYIHVNGFESILIIARVCQHRACLQCAHCGRRLDTHNLSDRDGVPYCRSCYGKVCGRTRCEEACMLMMMMFFFLFELQCTTSRTTGQRGRDTRCWAKQVANRCRQCCTRRRRQCRNYLSPGTRARHVVIGPLVPFSRRGSDPAGSGLLYTLVPTFCHHRLRPEFTTPSTYTAPYKSLHGALCPQIQGAISPSALRRCTVLIRTPCTPHSVKNQRRTRATSRSRHSPSFLVRFSLADHAVSPPAHAVPVHRHRQPHPDLEGVHKGPLLVNSYVCSRD